jgi:hypothetical protein
LKIDTQSEESEESKESKKKKEKMIKDLSKKQKAFHYQLQTDTMPGGIPATDNINSTFQHQTRTQSVQFLEDYSNT